MTKFLCYSLSKLNKVVWHYAELEKVCDGVYTYLKSKDQYREQDDLIAIVLKLETVYFEYRSYLRRSLVSQNVAKVGTEILANFHYSIDQTMKEGKHLQILFLRIYEELGRDTVPLIRYREERRLRQQEEEEEKKRQKEERQQQAKDREQERLRSVGEKFAAGEFITCEDFISLCKYEQILIPLRTHGTLHRSVKEISFMSISYTRMKGKPQPKLDGCFALAKTLHSKLTAK